MIQSDRRPFGAFEVAISPTRRSIDVPDPVNPPSGCRFHTRCPVAREACTNEQPPLYDVEGGDGNGAACFREDPDHEYWDSEPLEGAERIGPDEEFDTDDVSNDFGAETAGD